MRDALADVPAELRSPQMAILSIPSTPKTLPIFRGAFRLRTNAGRGVTVIKRSIGEPAIHAAMDVCERR
jgi:hypothetical protein